MDPIGDVADRDVLFREIRPEMKRLAIRTVELLVPPEPDGNQESMVRDTDQDVHLFACSVPVLHRQRVDSLFPHQKMILRLFLLAP